MIENELWDDFFKLPIDFRGFQNDKLTKMTDVTISLYLFIDTV